MLLPPNLGFTNFNEFFRAFLWVVFDSHFLWLPIILCFVGWKIWLHYIKYKFVQSIEWVLLEIKLPREITKSPKSIEVILNTFQQTYEGERWQQLFQGTIRTWWSFEIASIGGDIHFYIYTQKFFRNLVESQVYGQFPDAEIEEVEDYSKANYPLNTMGKDWDCWGAEYKLANDDSYPIKTYVDYGLDQLSTEEEQKTDPLTSFLELIGSISPDEQIWYQVILRATKTDWKKNGEDLVNKLMKRDKKAPTGEKLDFGALLLSPGERSTIEAIEKSFSKQAFDVGIRTMYFAPKGKINVMYGPAITGCMKQYNSLDLNGFKAINTPSANFFRVKQRKTSIKMDLLNAYRHRSHFYMPYPRKSFVLNTEEVATIFHFPGAVAETPTLGRIEAKKSEAPTNLPF